jgi:uroporphyrinogen decarboxylase
MIERLLDVAGKHVDFLWMGEDVGTQRGPTLSGELFDRHLRPRLQRFVDLGKKHSLPVMIHSCGSSSWAFDRFIEMGIEAVDTLQPEAVNMAPAYLKQNWGDKLALHGMISTAGPLAYGTPDEVVRVVKETLKIMMPGGGYALAPTHQIQDNSPTENVLAMYETARRYGKYE